MFCITKEFTFEAAHRLVGHPKCGRLHGHSYRVIVELQAQELEGGMVRDYADLAPIKNYLDTVLDHKYLVSNEQLDRKDPYYLAAPEADVSFLDLPRTTAENMAKYLFNVFKSNYPELTAVTVCETAKTSATYRFERGLR